MRFTEVVGLKFSQCTQGKYRIQLQNRSWYRDPRAAAGRDPPFIIVLCITSFSKQAQTQQHIPADRLLHNMYIHYIYNRLKADYVFHICIARVPNFHIYSQESSPENNVRTDSVR